MWKSVKRWIGIDRGAAAAVTGPVFDPDDPDFVRDPYPFLAQLRSDHPLYMSRFGAWVLTRYDDIVDALADRRLGNEPAPYAVINARNREQYVCADVANNTLPFREGGDHQRLRRVIAPTFHTYIKEGHLDIAGLAEGILDGHGDGSRIDLLKDFATPLSAAVLCRLLGFPERDGPRLKIWSDHFFYLFAMIPSPEVRERLDRALIEFRRYVGDVVEARKRERGGDLISRLLAQRDAGAEFTDQELVDNCMLLFADGIGNVDAGFANIMAALLAHPDQLRLLIKNEDLVENAVDEGLRFESPAQFIARIALEDITLHGQEIKKNQPLLLVLAAANRDPAVFQEPDRFDIRRGGGDYLSFGRGAHSCVGAQLVRLQMQAALRTVLKRLNNIKPAYRKPDWRTRFGHRWLNSLPVTADPRTAP